MADCPRGKPARPKYHYELREDKPATFTSAVDYLKQVHKKRPQYDIRGTSSWPVKGAANCHGFICHVLKRFLENHGKWYQWADTPGDLKATVLARVLGAGECLMRDLGTPCLVSL